MLHGMKLGKLICGVVLVLHLEALEICLSLDFVKKKCIGGRQYFKEGLHAVLKNPPKF